MKKLLFAAITIILIVFIGIMVINKTNKNNKLEEQDIKKELTWEIVDETSGLTCTDALEKIYEDENFIYSFPNGCYANNVFVKYSDGTKYTIGEVIKTNKLTIAELIEKGAKIYKNDKQIEKPESIEPEIKEPKPTNNTEISGPIVEKYKHDIVINNHNVNYKSNVDDEEELNEFLREFYDRYFQMLETLEYSDISDMFDNEENAYVYKTALEILIENRKRNKNDLSISNYKYELTIQDYKKNGNEISFQALENCSYNFGFIKQYTSSVYNIKNNFKLIKKDGKYKIKSYDKVQDFYVMVTQLYKSTTNYKSALDKIKNDYLDKFKSMDEKFDKMKNDYLNGNYQPKKCDHGYDRTAAYNYATKWVGRRNEDNWKSHGGANCANFVSQVMNTGGIPMDNKGNAKWYSNNKGKSETYSWINVSGITDYFKDNSGYGLCGKYDENIYLGEPGDMASVGPKNDHKHVIIVIGQIKNENGEVIDLLVASNTVDLIYFPLSAYPYPYKVLSKVYGYND